MCQIHRNRLISGFTLVELMVGITISIIVITMAVNIYVSTKRSYQKAKLNIEQNIKVISAQKVLSDAIVNAGLSCKYGSDHQLYVNRTGEDSRRFKFFYDNYSVRLGKLSTIENLLKNSSNQKFLFHSGTDYLMVKTENSSAELTQKPLNLSLYLDKTQQWQNGDYLALCNNDYIDIVKISSTNNETKQIRLASAPANEFNKGDYIGKINIQIFFTAATVDPKKPSEYKYSLYMLVKNGQAHATVYPIVEGVSDLKLTYVVSDNKNLSWKEIYQDTSLNEIGAKALKISFKLDNQYYDKVVLL